MLAMHCWQRQCNTIIRPFLTLHDIFQHSGIFKCAGLFNGALVSTVTWISFPSCLVDCCMINMMNYLYSYCSMTILCIHNAQEYLFIENRMHHIHVSVTVHMMIWQSSHAIQCHVFLFLTGQRLKVYRSIGERWVVEPLGYNGVARIFSVGGALGCGGLGFRRGALKFWADKPPPPPPAQKKNPHLIRVLIFPAEQADKQERRRGNHFCRDGQ